MAELTAPQESELKADLTHLEKMLRDQLLQAESSSKAVALDQQAMGRVSRIDAIQQQQMAEAGRQQCEVRLKQVVRALSALNDGDYGFCRSCDNTIGFGRLKIRPETPLCLSCQSKAEQTP